MLRRLKRSSPARAVLCLAVLLATATAFGLHPEPACDANGAVAAISRAGIVRSASSHQCVACLTHATYLSAPLIAAVLAPSAATDAAPLLAPLAPPRLSRTPCSGLSPPSLP